MFVRIPSSGVPFILVLGSDLIEVGDELVKGLPINDQTGHSIGRVADYVGRSQVITGNYINNIKL